MTGGSLLLRGLPRGTLVCRVNALVSYAPTAEVGRKADTNGLDYRRPRSRQAVSRSEGEARALRSVRRRLGHRGSPLSPRRPRSRAPVARRNPFWMDPGRKGGAGRLHDPGSGHGPSRPDRHDGAVLRSEAGRLAIRLDLPGPETRPDVHRTKDRGRDRPGEQDKRRLSGEMDLLRDHGELVPVARRGEPRPR